MDHLSTMLLGALATGFALAVGYLLGTVVATFIIDQWCRDFDDNLHEWDETEDHPTLF